MNPAYASSARCARALASAATDVRLMDWSTFARNVNDAEVVVLSVERLRGRELNRVYIFRAAHPMLPLVLVTDTESAPLSLISRVNADEVIDVRRTQCDIGAAMARAKRDSSLRRIASSIGAAEHLDMRLRSAIECLISAGFPIRYVQTLAGLTGCHRTTMHRLWHDGGAPRTGLTLSGLIDWMILIHGVRRKRDGVSWTAVATQLGVDRGRLRRCAKRTGFPLDSVAPLAQRAIVQKFVEEVVTPLLSA